MATDPEKIEAVKSWPVPQNVSQVRSFLGTCSYYRKFIRGYANIAKPLHVLTEKNRLFTWSTEAQEAFEILKAALVSSPILAYPNPEGQFILDTDASNHGIGAVLSQIQDEEERVIAYFSRTLNKAERQYCVTRKELLAIVTAVKHFHHYLYGKPFVIRTDHGALRWLTKFKNPEGQVARWLEVLGTYEFKIEHRQGRYYGNCDRLSRRPCEDILCKQCSRMERNLSETPVHVPARLPKYEESPKLTSMGEQKEDESPTINVIKTTPEEKNSSWVETMSSATIREAQLEDPLIGKVLRLKESRTEKPPWSEMSPLGYKMKGYWSSWELLHVQDGVLYREWVEKVGGRHRNLLVLPEKLRTKSFDDKAAGHLGETKTLYRIRERYYWVGFKEDVVSWCKRCPDCVQKEKPRTSNRAPMRIYNVGAPMKRVALDILGPLPLSERGNKYILCAGDYFTKWTWALPIPDQEARTVARVLVEHVFTSYGLPRIIYTDQGSNFESELFKKLCQYFDIEKTRTTPYRPQSNGFL